MGELPGRLGDLTHPITALAPMQDVTNLPFMKVIHHYGAPDYFFTEYFRVHVASHLEKHILSSITENTTGRPVFAQMIGESLSDLERTVRALQRYPIAGIDLNMGCPAPKVYKKNVGGGLLKDPTTIHNILGCLRSIIPGLFTVKMRIGFEDTRYFEEFMGLINEHKVDLLSLHGRTVKGMYHSEVQYDKIKEAAERVKCPVLANGNVTSAKKAKEVLSYTGAAGVMIGRSAIRNPWIFRQIREMFDKREVYEPKFYDVRDYVERLVESTQFCLHTEKSHLGKMKKFLNFVGTSVDGEGVFLKKMRYTTTLSELMKVCDETFLREPDQVFADEPYEGVIARPNCESPVENKEGNEAASCGMFAE